MKKKPLSTPKKATAARIAKTPTEASMQTGKTVHSPHDEVVAEKAYFMYLNQGSSDGFDVHHWLKAQAEVAAYQVGRIATVEAVIMANAMIDLQDTAHPQSPVTPSQ